MVYSDEISIKGSAVRAIIGTHGVTIRKLQDDYNVKMRFLGSNDEQYVERTLEITGMPRDVESARRRVSDIVEGRDVEFPPPSKAAGTTVPSWQKSGSNDTPMAAVVADEILVPTAIAHLVLGREAEKLKSIKQSQNLRYAEPEGIRITEDGREMRHVVLHGAAENVANALKLLQQLIDSHSVDFSKPPPKMTSGDSAQKSSFVLRRGGVPINNNRSDYQMSHWSGVRLSASSVNCNNGNGSDTSEAEIITFPSYSKNGSTVNGVNLSTHNEIEKLAERVSQLSEQQNRDVEHVSRKHCDGIVRAALEFAARAERDSQNELASLREQLASTRAQLEAARFNANTANGNGGMYAVEIADLKQQLRLKDSQLDGMLAENDTIKCHNEDLGVEIANLKSQLQDRQLISLNDTPATTNMCKKCGVQPRDAVVMPCLHLTHCKPCADKLTHCELCNSKVQTRLKIKIEKRA